MQENKVGVFFLNTVYIMLSATGTSLVEGGDGLGCTSPR